MHHMIIIEKKSKILLMLTELNIEELVKMEADSLYQQWSY